MSLNSTSAAEERDLNRARLKARLLAPAVNAALAPLLLAITIGSFISPKFLGSTPLTFAMWLYIGLAFCPAITIGSVWQSRLLTANRPLGERALSGLSAVVGMLVCLGSLAVTLAVLCLYGWVRFVMYTGVPAHVALKYLLIFALQGLLFFFLLVPYFMVTGALLGLVTAAVIHGVYNLNGIAGLATPQFAAVIAAGLGATFAVYIATARMPSLPEPESGQRSGVSAVRGVRDPTTYCSGGQHLSRYQCRLKKHGSLAAAAAAPLDSRVVMRGKSAVLQRSDAAACSAAQVLFCPAAGINRLSWASPPDVSSTGDGPDSVSKLEENNGP